MENLCTGVSWGPVNPVTNDVCLFVCLFLFRQKYLACLGYLGRVEPKMIDENNTRIQTPRLPGRRGSTTHVFKNSGSTSKQSREPLGVWLENTCNLRASFKILRPTQDRVLAVYCTWYSAYAVKSSMVSAHRFVGAPWGTWNRLVQKMRMNGVSSYGNVLPLLTY